MVNIREIRELFRLQQRIEELVDNYNSKSIDLDLDSRLCLTELEENQKVEVAWQSSSDMRC